MKLRIMETLCTALLIVQTKARSARMKQEGPIGAQTRICNTVVNPIIDTFLPNMNLGTVIF